MFPDLSRAAWDAYGQPLFAVAASAAGLSEMSGQEPEAGVEGGETAQGNGGVASAEGAPAADDEAGGLSVTYAMKEGETCMAIRQKVEGAGLDWDFSALEAANPELDLNVLEVGQAVNIPDDWALVFDPTAALPPMIKAQVLLGGEGDAEKEELAALWAQMSEGEQQAILSMGPLAEEARRVLELPAEAAADGGYLQGALDYASGLASGGVGAANRAYGTASSIWAGITASAVENTPQNSNVNADLERASALDASSLQAPTGDDVIYEDGASKQALQAKMEEIMRAYEAVQVEVPVGDTVITVDVKTMYRINTADDWLGVSKGSDGWNYKAKLEGGEGSDGIEHSEEFALAYGGRATPDELQVGFQEYIDTNAGLIEQLAATQDPEEARRLVQEHLQTKADGDGGTGGSLGVDCSGFVWNNLNSVDTFDEFTPVWSWDNENWFTVDETKDTAHDVRRANVSARALMENGTPIEDPAQWRPMDIMGWSSHVMMVYDCVTSAELEGMYEVTIFHSGSSTGPTRMTVYLWEGTYYSRPPTVDGETGEITRRGTKSWIDGSRPTVVRAQNNDLVQRERAGADRR